MKLIALFLFSIAAYGQNPNTAAFPTALATDSDLLAAKRVSESTLSAAITTTGALSATVADGTQFINYELVRIDNEEIKICSVSGSTLTICSGGRGFNGTTAATHASGASVRGVVTSWHHNQMAAEMKAVQGRVADLHAYCRSTTGNDSYTCTTVPPLAAYTTGRCVVLNADTGNTTGATLTVGALTTVSLLTRSGAALATGDIIANQPITACYNGTAFVVQGDGGGDVSAAGANTFTGYNDFSGGSMRWPETTVAGLPSAASNTGKIYVVTDGQSNPGNKCTSGAGTHRSACISTGSIWMPIEGNWSFGTGLGTACVAGSGCQVNLDVGAVLTIPYCSSTTSSATVYACTLDPDLASYMTGENIVWNVAGTACTGGTATTLNIDTLGAKKIFKMDGTTNPAANDCTANRRVLLSYDSTLDSSAGGWRIMNEYVTGSSGTIASQSESEAGTSNAVYASPKSMAQYVGCEIVKTSNTRVTVNRCTGMYGNLKVGSTADATMDISVSGTSTIYIGLNSGGLVVAQQTGQATLSCNAQCTVDATSRTTWAADWIPVGSVPYTSLVYGTPVMVGPLRSVQRVVAGSGGNISVAAGVDGAAEIDTSATPSFASVTSIIPWKTGTSDPGTCTVGQALYRTDGTPALKICSATNTWTAVGGASGFEREYIVGGTSTGGTAYVADGWSGQGATGVTGPTSPAAAIPPSFQFDDTGSDSSEVWLVMSPPGNYASQTVTLRLHVVSGSGITDGTSAVFAVKTGCAATAGAMAVTFGSDTNLTVAVSGGAGAAAHRTGTIVGLNMASCTSPGTLKISIRRTSGHASDNWNGAAYLYSAVLSF